MADKYTVQFTSSFDYSVVVEGIKKIKQELSSIHIGEEIANNLKKSLEKVEVELPGLEKFSKQTELSSKEADKYTKLIEKISKAIIAFNKEVDNTDFTKLSKIDTTKLQDLDRQIAAVEDRLKEAKKEITESFLKDEFKNAKSSTLTNAVTQLFDVKPEQIRDKFTEIENTVNQQVNESVTRVEQVLAQKTKAKDFSSGKKIIEAFFGEDSGVELATKVDNLKEKFNEIVGEYRTFAAGSEKARVKAKELLDLLNNPEYFKNDKNVTPFGLPTQQDLDLLNQLEGRITRIEEILKEKQPIIDADEGERVKLLEQRVIALEEALNSLKNTKENTKKTTEQLTDKLDEQRATVEKAKSEAEAYERQQKALDATFGGLIRRIENSASAMVIFNKSLQIVRQAIGSVKELDAAFTQIAIVSEQSSEQAWSMFESFNQLAKQYSITTKDLTEGAKLFYQQGLNAADTMRMVEASTVSAALGEVTMTEAANTLTAAIQGYNESAAVAMDYTDKIAMVGAVSAADFNELSTAMEKTASSAYTAGIDFDHLLGYLGKMIEVTREAPANLGTAMKTIIARFEDMKKDPMAILEDGVSANKVEAALATIGIALRDSEGEFRALQDVMDELGMKWNSLTRNQQAYIATVAAGSRQQSRFLALMNNYDRTLDLITESQNSAGAAAQQYAIYQDSIAAAQARLTASWEKFYSKIVDNGAIKTAINGLASLVDALSHVPPIITAIGAAIGALKLQQLFRLIRSKEAIARLSDIAKPFKELYQASGDTTKSFGELVKMSPKISNGLKNIRVNLTGVTSGFTAGLRAIGSFIAANIQWVAIAAGVALAIAFITTKINEQKRAYQENVELIKSYQEESDKLNQNVTSGNDLIKRYEELTHKIELTDEEQKELNDTINNIKNIYPQAITYLDEYGNMHLQNADRIKTEIEKEQELYNLRQKQIILQKRNLLSRNSNDLKEEDFNTIGWNSAATQSFFTNRQQLKKSTGINPARRLITNGLLDLATDTHYFYDLEARVNNVNEAIAQLGSSVQRLNPRTATFEDVLETVAAIKEEQRMASEYASTYAENMDKALEEMYKELDIQESFLSLSYSDDSGVSIAQKMLVSQLQDVFSRMNIDIWKNFLDNNGGTPEELSKRIQEILNSVTEENKEQFVNLFKDLTSGEINVSEFIAKISEISRGAGQVAVTEFAFGFAQQMEKQKEQMRQNAIEAVQYAFSGKERGIDFSSLDTNTLTAMKEMTDQGYKLSASQALDLAPYWNDLQKLLQERTKTGIFDGIQEAILAIITNSSLSEAEKAWFQKMAEEGLQAAVEGKTDELSQQLQGAMETLFSLTGKNYSSTDVGGAMDYAKKFGNDFLNHITTDDNGKMVLDTYAQMVVYQDKMIAQQEEVNNIIKQQEAMYETIPDKSSEEAKNLKNEIEAWNELYTKLVEHKRTFGELIDLTEEINKSTRLYNEEMKELGRTAEYTAETLQFSSEAGKNYEGAIKVAKELEQQMNKIGHVSRETMDELTAYSPAFADFFTIDEGTILFNLNNIVGDYESATEAIIDIARKQQEAQIEAKKIEMDNEIEYAIAKAASYEKLADLLEQYVHEVIANEHNMTDEERGELEKRITNEVSTHQTALDNAEETYNKHKAMAQKLYTQLAEMDANYWSNIGKENIQQSVRDIYNGLGTIHEAATLKAPDLIESGDPTKILEGAKNYRAAAKALREYAESLRKAKENLKVIDPTIYEELADKMESVGKEGADAMKKIADLAKKAADSIKKLDDLAKQLRADLKDINLDYDFFSDLFEAWEKEWDYYYNIKRLIQDLGQQGQYIDNIISADYSTADQKIAGYHAKIGNLISQMAANDTYITSLRTGMSQTALELMEQYGEYYKIDPNSGQIFQTDKNLNEINTTINAAKEELYNLSKVQNARQNDLNLENSKLDALEQEKSAYESILSELESQIDSYNNLDDVIVDTSELEEQRSAIKAKIEITDESIEAQKDKIRKMEEELQNLEVEIKLKGDVEAELEDYVSRMEEKVQEYEEYWDTLNSTIAEQQEILQQLAEVYNYYVDTAISTEQELYNAIVENYQNEINEKKKQYDYLKQLDRDYLASVKDNINKERQAREDANKQKNYQQSLQRLQLLQQDTSGAYRKEAAQLSQDIESQRQDLYDDLVDKQVEALEKEIDKRHELYDKEVAALEERLAYMQENAILLWEMVNGIVAEGADNMMAILENTTANINSSELARQRQRKQWEQNVKITFDGVVNKQIDNINTMIEKGNEYIDSLKEIKAAMETNITTYQSSTDTLIENNSNFQSAMDTFMTEWNRITNSFTGYYESWEKTVSSLKTALDNNIQALINMNNSGGSIKELDSTLRNAAKDMYNDFLAERQKYKDDLEKLIKQIQTDISVAIKNAASAINNAASNAQVVPDSSGLTGPSTPTTPTTPTGPGTPSQPKKYNAEVEGNLQDKTSGQSKRINKTFSNYNSTIEIVRAANDWIQEEIEKYEYELKSLYRQMGISSLVPNIQRGLKYKYYAKGGLANFTGPAWLDGTPSKPERILSPKQTKLFESMVSSLEHVASKSSSFSSGLGYNIGDIITTIQVDKLDNQTDINRLAKQVEDKIVKDIRNRVSVSVSKGV